ncbi:hypothetical protein HanRHA438_Chr08g0345971 [Helianthus annuus]|nr:hypothetical protein HanIR_Chr08g0361371 [Helianthus annuus]KAJ0897459.1 hypothetical protein HanRHA438_Chr08g0345971 [Helianthus annuus]
MSIISPNCSAWKARSKSGAVHRFSFASVNELVRNPIYPHQQDMEAFLNKLFFLNVCGMILSIFEKKIQFKKKIRNFFLVIKHSSRNATNIKKRLKDFIHKLQSINTKKKKKKKKKKKHDHVRMRLRTDLKQDLCSCFD